MSRDMEEYEAFAKRMEEKYPEMFSKPYGGFAVDQGWWPIIESLCANIQSHINWWNTNRKDRPVVEQVVVEQIKEKFGGLRFYYQGGDEYVRGLVTMAESWASHSCETCGAPGSRVGGGWIKTLCSTHAKEREERQARYAKENGFEM